MSPGPGVYLICFYFVWALCLFSVPVVRASRALWDIRWRLWRPLESFKAPSHASTIADQALLERVELIFREQMYVRILWVVRCFSTFFSPCLAVVLFMFTLNHIRGNRQDQLVAPLFRNLPVFPAQLLSVYLYFRPQAVSLCKFRVAYVLFVLREATVVVTLPKSGVPQPDGAALLAPEALIVVLALGRLWLSIMVQDARFITVVQSVLAALYLACALFTDLTVLYRGFCVAMVVFSILICISTTAIEKDAKHCIKAQLEASASQQYSAAANHLLSSMCDAVVCLSDKYEVIEGDRSLACLLQRREGLQPCLGMSFREIITSDADVATFESLMEQPCSDFARTVHITLRDSYSIAFPVQVYHAPALSADKRRIHILGLRESGDVLRSAPATHIAAETMRSVQAGALGGTEPSQTSGGGLGSISENETGDSEGLTIVNLASLQSRSLRAAASANTRQAALWLEPISLRMRAWTPAFADLFGASAFMQEDRSFLSLVQEDEHVKFLQRFQDAVHCKLEGEEEEEHGATIQVAVCGSCHGPVLLHCTVHFADCCISEGSAWSTPEGLDRDDESDGLPVVVLTVRAVRRLRSKRKRKVEDRKRQAGNSKAPAEVNDVTFPAQTSRTQILIRL